MRSVSRARGALSGAALLLSDPAFAETLFCTALGGLACPERPAFKASVIAVKLLVATTQELTTLQPCVVEAGPSIVATCLQGATGGVDRTKVADLTEILHAVSGVLPGDTLASAKAQLAGPDYAAVDRPVKLRVLKAMECRSLSTWKRAFADFANAARA